MPPRLLSLLPCCVHLSFHTGPRAPTLRSAWAIRARYQIGRSGKHDFGHVGGDVTDDAGAIGVRGSASTIAFATWNRRFGSVINRLRSASSEFLWFCPSFSGLVRTCVGCGLSRTQDCDPILVPLEGAGGH